MNGVPLWSVYHYERYTDISIWTVFWYDQERTQDLVNFFKNMFTSCRAKREILGGLLPSEQVLPPPQGT